MINAMCLMMALAPVPQPIAARGAFEIIDHDRWPHYLSYAGHGVDFPRISWQHAPHAGLVEMVTISLSRSGRNLILTESRASGSRVFIGEAPQRPTYGQWYRLNGEASAYARVRFFEYPGGLGF